MREGIPKRRASKMKTTRGTSNVHTSLGEEIEKGRDSVLRIRTAKESRRRCSRDLHTWGINISILDSSSQRIIRINVKHCATCRFHCAYSVNILPNHLLLSGVSPFVSFRLRSAPANTRSLAISTCPNLAAKYRAVRPYCSPTFNQHPEHIQTRTSYLHRYV